MTGREIFGPFISMLLLTLVVWVYMYARRLTFFKTSNIDTRQLTTPEKAAQVIPEAVSYPAHNLRNLSELPVAFYALCLYLYAGGLVDATYVAAAWVFVGFRVVHSLIHCTGNIVIWRFLAYMAGALSLWFMVLRAAISYFG